MSFQKTAGQYMAILFGMLCIAAPLRATPYIPTDGAQVIEKLPSRNDPLQKEFNRMRAELSTAPTDLALAARFARRSIEIARSNADPRYLGYAQAALAPWWSRPEPPVEVRLLRATLLQSTHQFPAALADLDAVIKTDPRNGQAWLTRATVLTVQGEYEQAKKSCAKLYSLAPELVAMTCLSNVANLNGQAQRSYALLSAALTRNTDAEPALQAWVMTLLAEMAQRRGDYPVAEAHFRKALSLTGAESYLLGAYADFLLDRGRAAEAAALLKNETRVDGLLLRYALALKAERSSAAVQRIEELDARFKAAILRGDTVHQREQARFELQLRGDAKAALLLAEKNWAIQKEPADARIYLEAAWQAKDKPAAKTVLDWVRKNGLEDAALHELAVTIGGGAA